jgi:hypothetical protein
MPSLGGQVELQANEIHEIDSYELPLPTIMEETPEGMSSVALPMPQPTPPRFRLSAPLSTVQPAELESVSWNPPPEADTISPIDLTFFPDGQRGGTELRRPIAQGEPSDFAQYRAQAKRRSKILAPSTSVRSNKSIDTIDTIETIDSISSTNSKDSATSTISYAASTVSSLSEGWASGANFDSTLSPPANESLSTSRFDLPPPSIEGLPDMIEMPAGFESYGNHGCVDHVESGFTSSLTCELPADVPMADYEISSVPVASSMASFQDPFPFASPTMSALQLDTGLLVGHEQPPPAAEPLTGPLIAPDNTKSSANHIMWNLGSRRR